MKDAIRLGFWNPKLVSSEPHLAALRRSDAFVTLLTSFGMPAWVFAPPPASPTTPTPPAPKATSSTSHSTASTTQSTSTLFVPAATPPPASPRRAALPHVAYTSLPARGAAPLVATAYSPMPAGGAAAAAAAVAAPTSTLYTAFIASPAAAAPPQYETIPDDWR